MRSEFKAYDLIAVHAGLACGLNLPSVSEAAALSADGLAALCGRVAEDADSASLRDKLTLEFERRLRDPAYSGHAVAEWFRDTYGPIGRSSIYRTAASLRCQESRIAECAAQAQAYVDLAADSGADAVFAAGSGRAGQLIFQLLMETNAAALSGEMNLDKLHKIVSALAKLQKSRAETELLGEKIDQMRRKFDKAAKVAATKAAGGALTDDMIAEVRRAVFGEAA